MSKNDHQGRTLEQEYRHQLKLEGSDRAVIHHLLLERLFAVKTMIGIRNDLMEVIMHDLGSLIEEAKEDFHVPDSLVKRLEAVDKKIDQWNHVTTVQDTLLRR